MNTHFALTNVTLKCAVQRVSSSDSKPEAGEQPQAEVGMPADDDGNTGDHEEDMEVEGNSPKRPRNDWHRIY